MISIDFGVTGLIATQQPDFLYNSQHFSREEITIITSDRSGVSVSPSPYPLRSATQNAAHF